MIGKINSNILKLNEKNVLRYAGQKSGKVVGKLKDILFKEIDECKNLSDIRYTYNIYHEANCPIPVYGDKLTEMLKGTKHIAFFILTVGPLIDRKINKYFESGSYTNAIMLDAAATELVEKSADFLEDIIKKDTNSKKSTSRFSPGYGKWDLSVQPHILKYLNGDKIGVSLNESYFLIPRKTITAVIGLEGDCDKSDNGCSDCNFDCEFRRE
jgi:hypothetical protein